MFEMNVPYDKGQMKIKLEDKNLAGVLEGRQSDYKTTLSENEIVEQSLNNPIGSKSLEELAKGKKNIVIISSDHTRPEDPEAREQNLLIILPIFFLQNIF